MPNGSPYGWRDGSLVKSAFCPYRRPILVSCTQQFTTMYDPSSRGSIVLFWSLWALCAHATQTYMQVKHTHMQKIKRNKMVILFSSVGQYQYLLYMLRDHLRIFTSNYFQIHPYLKNPRRPILLIFHGSLRLCFYMI